MTGGKVKTLTIAERRVIPVVRPYLVAGAERIEVDVCTVCFAVVLQPIDHWKWHEKEKVDNV